jgi:hypothetical protein
MLLSKEENLKVRRNKRYRNAFINLWLKTNNHWEAIKACDWNEEGFNFDLSIKIRHSNVLFKKDQKQFNGTIVWVLKHEDDDTIMEIILNNLLFARVMKLTDNKNTMHRIFVMIRTLGVREAKRELLDIFGIELSDKELERLKDNYKSEHRLYRYGVKVESQEWSKMVRHIIETEPAVETGDEIIRELREFIQNNPR